MSAVDPASPAAEKVRLITVCTGNICRSPYAAVLLQEGLGWARPGVFEVTSAGTHALVGRPMDAGSQRLLDAKGVSTGAAPARMLSTRVLQQQAFVLVMSERHREAVLDECPGVHRRTLGILDLAQALEQVAAEYSWADLLADVGAKEVRARWRALPELLLALGASPVHVAEVGDPYGKNEAAFARMADQLDAAVRSIVLWEAQFPR